MGLSFFLAKITSLYWIGSQDFVIKKQQKWSQILNLQHYNKYQLSDSIENYKDKKVWYLYNNELYMYTFQMICVVSLK